MGKNTKLITTSAILIAMYVALSYVAIDLKVMKFSFAGLPVIVGGFLFGPIPGLMIGAVGATLEQLIRYGITATTVLWIVPVAARGLIVGWYAKKKDFKMTTFEMGFIMILSALVVTVLNTVGIYIDSHIYHYYNFATVFGAIGMRVVTAIVTCLVYLSIMPYLLKGLRQAGIRTEEVI